MAGAPVRLTGILLIFPDFTIAVIKWPRSTSIMMRGFRGIRTSRIKAAKRFLYVKRRTSFSGKEKKSDADVARIHGKKEKNRLVCDIAKKEKRNPCRFRWSHLRLRKFTATARDKCLVKWKRC